MRGSGGAHVQPNHPGDEDDDDAAPSRRGNVVFLTQMIGIGRAAYIVPAELSVDAGLKAPVQAESE